MTMRKFQRAALWQAVNRCERWRIESWTCCKKFLQATDSCENLNSAQRAVSSSKWKTWIPAVVLRKKLNTVKYNFKANTSVFGFGTSIFASTKFPVVSVVLKSLQEGFRLTVCLPMLHTKCFCDCPAAVWSCNVQIPVWPKWTVFWCPCQSFWTETCVRKRGIRDFVSTQQCKSNCGYNWCVCPAPEVNSRRQHIWQQRLWLVNGSYASKFVRHFHCRKRLQKDATLDNLCWCRQMQWRLFILSVLKKRRERH